MFRLLKDDNLVEIHQSPLSRKVNCFSKNSRLILVPS
jgi:hypothetical protein